MSSTGATLSGSYSGASSVPTAAGFKYGTTSGNLTQTASSSPSASGTSGDLSATLTGLTAGTTYYYKAFATVSGTGDYSSQSETFYGTQYSFKTKAVATSTVTTSAATSITSTTAQLNGSFSGASGAIYETGFYWGTTSNPATEVTGDGSNASSGNFSYSLISLAASTTYYYKAFVREYSEESGQYVERTGSVQSFTTTAAVQASLPGYLGCYEMPAVSLVNNSAPTNTGAETFGSATWLMHQTTTASQRIVTHRYYFNGSSNTSDSGNLYRNYTALVDQNKRCALWTAYPMHAGAYPNLDAERYKFDEKTSYDPAIPDSWQSSGATSDYNNGAGYARGHHCASEDRQTTQIANQQTFYYTNQSPQRQNGFNGGIWASLEGRVQSTSPTGRDTMYVVVGLLFEGNNTHDSNDGGNVGLPSHFYKLLMKCSFNTSGAMTAAQGIAFIYTNEAHTGNYYDSEYVTSIDSIEQRAGFDFFANVPTSLQNSAESNTSHTWFTGQ